MKHRAILNRITVVAPRLFLLIVITLTLSLFPLHPVGAEGGAPGLKMVNKTRPAAPDAFTETAAFTTVVFNNSNFAEINGDRFFRSIFVKPDDFPSEAVITDVNLTVRFQKTSGTCDIPDSGDPDNSELTFDLTSPGGTSIGLISPATYSDSTPGGLVEVTFDNSAAEVVGAGTGFPVSGTFRPGGPWSMTNFFGEKPAGLWTLRMIDHHPQNPLCFHQVALEITAEVPADMSIIKSLVSGPVTGGKTISIDLVVANGGPGSANHVTVQDLNPLKEVVTWTQLPPAWSCNGEILCVRSSPMPPAVVETLSYQLSISTGREAGLDRSPASVTSNNIDLNISNNQSMAAYRVITAADLSVRQISLPSLVEPGEGFLYQIQVTNNGPSRADNLVVTDALGDHLLFSAASLGCQDQPSSSQVVCSMESLAVGQTASFLITVIAGDAPAGSVLVNKVRATSTTIDPDRTNNSAQATTTVKKPTGPSTDLSLTIDVGGNSVIAGDLVTYTLSVKNAGTATATNVQVLELLPDGTSLAGASTGNYDVDVDICNKNGLCTLRTIEAGKVAEVIVALQVSPGFRGESLTNLARVSADQMDRFPENNFASRAILVSSWANLSLNSSILEETVMAGETLNYLFLIENTGPSEAREVVFLDQLPDGVELVSTSTDCVVVDKQLTCLLGTLPVGAPEMITLCVRVDPAMKPETILTSQMLLSAGNSEVISRSIETPVLSDVQE